MVLQVKLNWTVPEFAFSIKWFSNVLLIRWSWKFFWWSVMVAYNIISFFRGSSCSTSAFILLRRKGRNIACSFATTCRRWNSIKYYIYIIKCSKDVNDKNRYKKNVNELNNGNNEYLSPSLLFHFLPHCFTVTLSWQIKPENKCLKAKCQIPYISSSEHKAIHKRHPRPKDKKYQRKCLN